MRVFKGWQLRDHQPHCSHVTYNCWFLWILKHCGDSLFEEVGHDYKGQPCWHKCAKKRAVSVRIIDNENSVLLLVTIWKLQTFMWGLNVQENLLCWSNNSNFCKVAYYVFGQDVGMRFERWNNEVCASVHGVCEAWGNWFHKWWKQNCDIHLCLGMLIVMVKSRRWMWIGLMGSL